MVLEKDDLVAMVTDGVTEAASADDREFGDEGVIDVLRRGRGEGAEVALRSLVEAVHHWTGAVGCADDLTALGFVVESGKTRKVMAKAAMKRLQQAGVNPLGVILTKIDAYHDLYGYHSYYYQYASNDPGTGRKEVVGA